MNLIACMCWLQHFYSETTPELGWSCSDDSGGFEFKFSDNNISIVGHTKNNESVVILNRKIRDLNDSNFVLTQLIKSFQTTKPHFAPHNAEGHVRELLENLEEFWGISSEQLIDMIKTYQCKKVLEDA